MNRSGRRRERLKCRALRKIAEGIELVQPEEKNSLEVPDCTFHLKDPTGGLSGQQGWACSVSLREQKQKQWGWMGVHRK